jgi:hypothetical protein
MRKIPSLVLFAATFFGVKLLNPWVVKHGLIAAMCSIVVLLALAVDAVRSSQKLQKLWTIRPLLLWAAMGILTFLISPLVGKGSAAHSNFIFVGIAVAAVFAIAIDVLANRRGYVAAWM